MIPALDAALSALLAFGKKMDVSANNVANVNTEGFKKSRALLEDAEPGVVVTLSRVNTPGSPLPSQDGTGKMRESSNVDLAEEIVDQHTTKAAFQASVATVKAEKEMLGSLFDALA
jgi:flagellar basal-body rod protein FlgC